MKIATYNVNGVNGRLPVLVDWLRSARPDVVCLQELKASQETFLKGFAPNLGQKDRMGYGIEFPESVDLVSKNDAEHRVTLIVVGPDTWSGANDERDRLARKLETYLIYVESEQFEKKFPKLLGYRVVFEIHTRTALPASLRQWIEDNGQVLQNNYNVTLSVIQIS